MDFNKIVKKLWNKWWKVIFKNDIFDLIDPEQKPEYQGKLNKLIYRLKSEGYILPLKSGVYIIPDSEDVSLNSVDLLDKYYLKLLKKYITQEVWSHYYISGKKSLEFHLKNMSIPEKITVINRGVNKKVQVGNYEIQFQTCTGKLGGKKYNLYNTFAPYTKTIEVEGVKLKISNLELSLVESALIHEAYEGVDTTPIVTALKKYVWVFDTNIFYEIGKYKYNMSFNRLKEISRPLSTELYEVFLDVIKKNGGCFVGEWLRGM